jgi:hypothetical protein
VIALTQKDVLAHEVAVPWSEPYQIEQDLLLCLAMHAIFEGRFLSGQVAMRGGTVLHKVHLAPAARLVEREKFIAHLRQCLADWAGLCTDIDSFLRRDLSYDPHVAGAFIERHLLGLLPT